MLWLTIIFIIISNKYVLNQRIPQFVEFKCLNIISLKTYSYFYKEMILYNHI